MKNSIYVPGLKVKMDLLYKLIVSVILLFVINPNDQISFLNEKCSEYFLHTSKLIFSVYLLINSCCYFTRFVMSIFGVDLKDTLMREPWKSKSMKEFWLRWNYPV